MLLEILNYRITGIRQIIFENDLLINLQDLISHRSSLLICDENTQYFIPLTLRMERNLKRIVLPRDVQPTELEIRRLVKHTQDRELIIALGAGTITDICKCLAKITNREFIIFPTAPSVNAYTSPTASIMPIGSNKKYSIKAKMPIGIYIDRGILKKAPTRMIVSGLCDLVCSSTIKVDCLIASIALKQEYATIIFEELKHYEKILLKYSKLLVKGDIMLIELLMQALILSGLGMWLHGDSRTASQSEHVVAHILERKYSRHFLHGEMVAVGIILVSMIQEKLFRKEGKITFMTKAFELYKKQKSSSSLTPETFTKVLEDLSSITPLLRFLTSGHDQLRKHIIDLNETLPKMCGSFEEMLLFKENFTCLDLAYLKGCA
ncbi:3-dehydroquinate synthase family protein [Neorickettsia helminthoeca str. Oregon]|uniref:3-dehydroquinate synthase family protein n=1 Tax=Neorickettsia helminthoeca str. Oregon TaxID=1286528 RepID=X5H5F0_9RICK|nr:iron-containing alcohol dehydrogenase [Neorickettsia helminthoeca]AHX11816.1 3-dehydroquinate synthase family protein [Neorickettsia helminthoeca str. Oregon]